MRTAQRQQEVAASCGEMISSERFKDLVSKVTRVFEFGRCADAQTYFAHADRVIDVPHLEFVAWHVTSHRIRIRCSCEDEFETFVDEFSWIKEYEGFRHRIDGLARGEGEQPALDVAKHPLLESC